MMAEIPPDMAERFILPRHYSGRMPSISKAFGWFVNDDLQAACTFGKPASPNICEGICGKEFSHSVFELNRLCRATGFSKQISKFVGFCLRELKKENWIIVSYSDSAMNHHGYIYQATNFLYTGMTKERTDMFAGFGKHSRHGSIASGMRKVRSSKHRYIYFCTNDKKLKKLWRSSLNYPVLPYPKGNNSEDYKPGFILQESVFDASGNPVQKENRQISMF